MRERIQGRLQLAWSVAHIRGRQGTTPMTSDIPPPFVRRDRRPGERTGAEYDRWEHAGIDWDENSRSQCTASTFVALLTPTQPPPSEGEVPAGALGGIVPQARCHPGGGRSSLRLFRSPWRRRHLMMDSGLRRNDPVGGRHGTKARLPVDPRLTENVCLAPLSP